MDQEQAMSYRSGFGVLLTSDFWLSCVGALFIIIPVAMACAGMYACTDNIHRTRALEEKLK